MNWSGIAALGLTLALPLAMPNPVLAQRALKSAPACAAEGDLQFVCNLANVEDILPVAGGRWLVGSSLKPGSVGLYLIDTAAKTARSVNLSIAAKTDPVYAGCAAPDLAGLSTHGLDVIPETGGVSTVYAVNHGTRESVEVFRLHAARGSAEWIGCVVLPEGAMGNAVAALPGGGFLVTKWLDTRNRQDIGNVLAGRVNGLVYKWQPQGGFSVVPGTQLSGDNGILVSPDGKWAFVNAWGTKEIYRVALFGYGESKSVRVDFHPDNLRWAPDGTIFVTGQYLRPFGTPGPSLGWATARLNPRTMAITPLISEPGYAQFDSGTSSVQLGKTLWIGTYHGDRIAYRSMP